MKKLILLVIIVSICFLFNSIILCPQAHAKTYKIAMTHWVGFSPLNVADVKGFWKEQGVDVEVVNNLDVELITKQVETKEVDFGLHMMGTWVAQYMDNVPVTIIAETDWSNGGDKIIAKKDLVVSQLKGKPVGTYDTSSAVTFFLNKYLTENNLTIADVKLVQFDPENLADNLDRKSVV